MSPKISVHSCTSFILCILLILSGCSQPVATTQPVVQPGSTTVPEQPTLAAPTSQPTGESQITETALPTEVVQSTEETQPADAAIVDACTLLTKEDAEKILGKPVKAPKTPVQGSETFNVTSCSYQIDGGTAMDTASVIVIIPSLGDAGFARESFENDKKTVKDSYGADPVDVAYLGDEAYWVAGAGNILFVLQGKVQITLKAATQKGDTASPELIELARLVLSRLPE